MMLRYIKVLISFGLSCLILGLLNNLFPEAEVIYSPVFTSLLFAAMTILIVFIFSGKKTYTSKIRQRIEYVIRNDTGEPDEEFDLEKYSAFEEVFSDPEGRTLVDENSQTINTVFSEKTISVIKESIKLPEFLFCCVCIALMTVVYNCIAQGGWLIIARDEGAAVALSDFINTLGERFRDGNFGIFEENARELVSNAEIRFSGIEQTVGEMLKRATESFYSLVQMFL